MRELPPDFLLQEGVDWTLLLKLASRGSSWANVPPSARDFLAAVRPLLQILQGALRAGQEDVAH